MTLLWLQIVPDFNVTTGFVFTNHWNVTGGSTVMMVVMS